MSDVDKVLRVIERADELRDRWRELHHLIVPIEKQLVDAENELFQLVNDFVLSKENYPLIINDRYMVVIDSSGKNKLAVRGID